MVTLNDPKTGRLLLVSAFAFLLLLPLLSCIRERDRAAEVKKIIAERVKARLAEYREIRLQRCREELMKEAARRADSVVVAQAELLRDTLSRPPKPLRPERPERAAPADTTPLRPLLPRDTDKE